MKSTPLQDHRRFIRIPFKADVQLALHDGTIKVHLVDLALKGALVQCDTSHVVRLHEKCRLELPLADDGDGVVMTGQVVHLDGKLVGIECQEIDITSLTRLRRLIELNTGNADLMDRELSSLFR
ncbi:MAG: PilZ domain-containing protein [Pseudomonadota bacterium]